MDCQPGEIGSRKEIIKIAPILIFGQASVNTMYFYREGTVLICYTIGTGGSFDPVTSIIPSAFQRKNYFG
jgi:hypothetical protein